VSGAASGGRAAQSVPQNYSGYWLLAPGSFLGHCNVHRIVMKWKLCDVVKS
jgi:hypothetical protein